VLTDLLLRLRALISRRTVEREIDEELRFHLDRQVEAYERSGVDRAEHHCGDRGADAADRLRKRRKPAARGRRHELSVRLALGASRWRLARQLFVESLMLSAAGAVLGVLIAAFIGPFLVRQLSTPTR
jgi:hypothetical protein